MFVVNCCNMQSLACFVSKIEHSCGEIFMLKKFRIVLFFIVNWEIFIVRVFLYACATKKKINMKGIFYSKYLEHAQCDIP